MLLFFLALNYGCDSLCFHLNYSTVLDLRLLVKQTLSSLNCFFVRVFAAAMEMQLEHLPRTFSCGGGIFYLGGSACQQALNHIRIKICLGSLLNCL